MKQRFRDLNGFLREHFGCRVQKISVDAGMTCPNRDGTLSRGGCIYCNPKGSGTGAFARGLTVTEQIEAGKFWMVKRYKAKRFIVYFQSFTNTYAPVETLRELYGQALAVDGVVGLSIGTRPDCVSPPVLDLLAGYAETSMIWLEYGLQSAHDATLARINRGHDFKCFEKAVIATRGRGIRICAHVILGLPGEGRKEMRATADALTRLGIDGVKLHLLYAVRGTKLAEMVRQGTYRCLERAEYADLVCDFLERLPPNVVVQRLTSDPHPDELAAPAWALEKQKNIDAVLNRIETRDAWQGKALDKGPVQKQPTI
jgi:uncharacterized protein